MVNDVIDIVNSVINDNIFIVVDGYYGFMVKFIDIVNIVYWVFYFVGSYKYV